MTMPKTHACDAIREMVFNYRRGELSELDAALFEESVDGCPQCSRYAGRIIEMLDLASEATEDDFIEEPLDSGRADDLFVSIARAVDPVPSSKNVYPFVSSTSLVESRENDAWSCEEQEASRPRWVPRLVFAAAAIAAVCIGAALMFGVDDAPLFPEAPQRAAITGPSAPVASATTSPASALDQAFATLKATPSKAAAVSIFADDDATWRLTDHEGESNTHRYTLKLESGTVLVEFLPQHNETLRVVSGDTEVNVLGTVFYVSAPDDQPQGAAPGSARVGVITGKVRVERAPKSADSDHQTITLEGGAELEPQSMKAVPIEAVRTQRAASLVDLKAHEQALQQRAAKQPALAAREPVTQRTNRTPRPPAAVKAPAAREDAASLREQARAALGRRDYRAASQAYERLLSRLPEQHGDRATLRLELARLYMRQLGDRDHAVSHLRLFVEQHPNDVAASSARRQLCRLLGPSATKEPGCLSGEMP